MTYNPFKDPKFLTALLDALISAALYFVSKYAAPGVLDDVKFIIGAYQPIVAMLIAGYFQADAAAKSAGLQLPHLTKSK